MRYSGVSLTIIHWPTTIQDLFHYSTTSLNNQQLNSSRPNLNWEQQAKYSENSDPT
jgi:hypothetical protein